MLYSQFAKKSDSCFLVFNFITTSLTLLLIISAPFAQGYQQPGPSQQRDVEQIVDAVEQYGQDWESVSEIMNIPSENCKLAFHSLVRQAKQENAVFAKESKRTGMIIIHWCYMIIDKLIIPYNNSQHQLHKSV